MSFRWLQSVLVILVTLIAAAGSLHATFQESPKTASGVLGVESNIDTYRSDLVTEGTRPEITIVVYDPVTGVWDYVNQNPWTKFDPLGLWFTAAKRALKAKKLWRNADGVIRPGLGKRGQARLANGRAVRMPSSLERSGMMYEHIGSETGKTYKIFFDKDGFPSFDRYVETINGRKAQVRIDNLDGTKTDFARANEKMKITEQWVEENGLVWHHIEDGVTMQLVKKALNNELAHTGGRAVIESAQQVAKANGLLQRGTDLMGNIVAPNITRALKGDEDLSDSIGRDAFSYTPPGQVLDIIEPLGEKVDRAWEISNTPGKRHNSNTGIPLQ